MYEALLQVAGGAASGRFASGNERIYQMPEALSYYCIYQMPEALSYQMYEALSYYRWPEARHLVDALVCHDPSKRPSAAQALLHPFFWSHVRPQPYSLSLLRWLFCIPSSWGSLALACLLLEPRV